MSRIFRTACFRALLLALFCPGLFVGAITLRAHFAPGDRVAIYGELRGNEAVGRIPLSAMDVAGLRRVLPPGSIAVMEPCRHSMRACIDVQTQSGMQRLSGAFVEAGTGHILGLAVVEGTTTAATDAAWITEAAWHRYFGGDPQMVGNVITLVMGDAVRETTAVRISAVVRPTAPMGALDTDIWLPFGLERALMAQSARPQFVAVADANAVQGMASMNALLAASGDAILSQHPASMRSVLAFRGEWLGHVAIADTSTETLRFAGVLLGTFLVICVTVAGQQWSVVEAARQNVRVRLMLGATEWQALKPLMAQTVASAILSVLMGGLGTLLGWMIVKERLSQYWSAPLELGFAESSVAFLLCAGILTVISLMVPLGALRQSSELRGASRPSLYARRATLVIIAAGSVTLAGLLPTVLAPLRNLGRLEAQALQPNTFVGELALFPRDYPGEGDARRFMNRLLDDVGRQPGVSAVALTSHVPSVNDPDVDLARPLIGDTSKRTVRVALVYVSENYQRFFTSEMARGRMISATDLDARELVAVLSSEAARALFGDNDALDRSFELRGSRYRVVGLLSPQPSPRPDQEPPVVLAARQHDHMLMSLLISPATGASSIERVQDVVGRAAGSQPVANIRPYSAAIMDGVRPAVFVAAALVGGAILVLFCVVVGTAALMNVMVANRLHELAIRQALGAAPRQLAWSLLRVDAVLLGIGAMVGIVAVVLLHRLMGLAGTEGTPYVMSGAAGAAVVMWTAGILGGLPSVVAASRAPAVRGLLQAG